jgi:hypothetical protein
MPSETDLAWAAGIFDGEACIAINRYSPNKNQRNKAMVYRPHVCINMTHKPTLERLVGILGGTIHKHSRSQLTRKQAWRWTVADRKADAVLRSVLPYLFTKRGEAEMVLQFYSLGHATRWTGIAPELLAAREALFMAVREAKTEQWIQ